MSKRRARGEGSVRKRSDGRWEGRYTAGRNEETGKLIYKSVLARTQAECKRLLREAIWNREYKTEPPLHVFIHKREIRRLENRRPPIRRL